MSSRQRRPHFELGPQPDQAMVDSGEIVEPVNLLSMRVIIPRLEGRVLMAE